MEQYPANLDDYYPSMSRLALSFPALAAKAREGHCGIAPFNAALLLAKSKPWSSSEKLAAQFVLHVFNAAAYPQFCLARALAVWDHRHRAAFVEWAQEPYFV